MSGYTKLFSSLPNSTIWKEPNETRIVWITMLAMANMDGIVDASVPGLADLARVDLEKCETALKTLMSPDKYSRTKTDEGRRVKEIDGGWLIINHAKYRDTLKSDRLGNAENRKGKIYFIKCDTLLKIGFSKNPWARLAALKTGMSGEVSFLGCIDGTLREELDFHKNLQGSRFNREWYSITPEIIRFLNENNITTSSCMVAATKNGSAIESLQYATTEAKADSETDTKEETPLIIVSSLPKEMDFWNMNCGTLPKAQSTNTKRNAALRARRADPFWVENYPKAVFEVMKSEFCNGKNDRGWKADFDFMIQPDTVTKVMEGKYQNRNGYQKERPAGGNY